MFLLVFPLVLLTTLSTGVLVFTLTLTSPTNQSGALVPINLSYFFVSSFISLAGIITLVLYFVGSWRLAKTRTAGTDLLHRPKLILLRSLRHGILIAAAVVGIGLMNALKFSNPLNIILLISAAALIEVYFFGH